MTKVNIHEIKEITKAVNPQNVVITIKYDSNPWKNYIYTRKTFKNKDGSNGVIIAGDLIKFNNDLEVISVEARYETKGKRKQSGGVQKVRVPEVNPQVESIEDIIEELEVEAKATNLVEEVELFEDGEIKHEQFGKIKSCVENNIPVYLVGPAGSGKNFTLEQIAWELGLEFYFTNSVQDEYKLTGFIDAGGKYHETEFYKAFKNGGLFFLDELDASIPEVLVLLNAAIANGYFAFPNEKIHAHENFRVVAAGNTVGNGADEQYTGRTVIDQATLDRFAIIFFDYSERIELNITGNNKELVNFIRELRKQSQEKGIRATYSYRCMMMVVKLEKTNIALEDIIGIAVIKGMDRDTLNTYSVAEYQSKYHKAFLEARQNVKAA